MSSQKILFPLVEPQQPSINPGFSLRYYQEEAVRNAFKAFADGSPGAIVRCATGTGKTCIAIAMIDTWLQRSPYHRAIVISHERELVHQFAQEIEDFIHIVPAIEMGTDRIKDDACPQVVVASRASLYQKDVNGTIESRLFKFDNQHNWLVVIDEVHRHLLKGLKSCAHIYSWFAQNPESKRLGLTATPRRGDKRTLSDLVPTPVCDYPLFTIDESKPCAVRDGYAVPYDQRFIQVEGVDWKNIREVSNDFDPHELAAALEDRKALLSYVQPMLDMVGDRSTLIFSPTVRMAKEVAHTINNEVGSEVAVQIDGSTRPGDRRLAYARHKAGHFQHLSVCGLCREGYNDPNIAAVAIFRPTKSLMLAEQMKGRGCRCLPGLVDGIKTREERLDIIRHSKKPDCMIIDLVGTSGMCDTATTAHILAHGLPDDVIKRANKNALTKTGSVDMVSEIKEAIKQIETETLAREAAERALQEKMAKLALIKGRVNYTSTKVKGAFKQTTRRRTVMPFGKYKGSALSNVPTGYLNWVATSVSRKGWLANAVKRELQTRKTHTSTMRDHFKSTSNTPWGHEWSPMMDTPTDYR